MKTEKGSLKFDIPAGLVVFLVALPLCLGISQTSKAPFFSGLISGIIGGIVIGLLSSSKTSVSGPAAGLATLVAGAILDIGSFNLFLCAVVIAGGLQLLMSVGRLGGIANYFPSSVVKGMLTSIGILIVVNQLTHAVGYDKNDQGDVIELFALESHTLQEELKFLNHINMGAVILCVVSIVIMILWEKPFIKNRVKFVPGALVAVAVSIGLNEVFRSMGSPLYMGGEHLVNIQVAKSPSEFFGFFTLPDLGGFLNGKVILYGFFIAIIASLETLLSIEAVDSIDPKRNVTNRNRELFAQGIGNTISGFIGGLPITSVIVRSSANISAGARSKKSTIFHGILLLSTLILIPGILNMIPRAALAAILILTGYKLCKLSVFKTMFRNGKYQYIPFAVTVLFIIGIDLIGIIPFLKGKGLLVGVTAGLISAFGAILHGNLKNSYFFHKNKHKEGDVIHIRLAEEVSFLNKASIRETLDHLPENSTVKIDASHTDYIDFDVLELIKEFRDIKAPLKKITLQLEGFKEVYRIENKLNVQSVH